MLKFGISARLAPGIFAFPPVGAMAVAKVVATLALLAVALASSEGPEAPAADVEGVAPMLRGAEPALSAQAEGSGCGMLGGMAPKCMQDCPEMCKPMKEAEGKFLHGKGSRKEKRAAALAQLCKHKSAFMCGQRNKKHCDVLAEKAKMFGFSMPRTVGAFDEQCHR